MSRRGLGAAAVRWGTDVGPVVEVRVCTTPDRKKPPVCKDGYAIIDTGAPNTYLAAGNLPKEMFPPGFLKAKGDTACYLGMEKGVEVCQAKAEFTFPGCAEGTTIPVRVAPRELPRRNVFALLGIDVLKAVGATVHPERSPRTILACRRGRKPRAPYRLGRACGGGDPRICGHVTVCPPGVKNDKDPGCIGLKAIFDTGAAVTALSATFPQTPERALLFPVVGATSGGTSWEGEQSTPQPVIEASISTPGCGQWALHPTILPPWNPLPLGADVLVGMDYLREAKVELRPWAKPPFATCKKWHSGRRRPTAIAPQVEDAPGAIEW